MPGSNLTEKQRDEVLDVCKSLISAGISFAHYYEENGQPVYPATRGLADIERIMKGDEGNG